MANLSKCSRQSQLTRSTGHRTGPAGFHHNPQDFSRMGAGQAPSRTEFLRKNWHFLPPAARGFANRLSSSYRPHQQAPVQLSLEGI